MAYPEILTKKYLTMFDEINRLMPRILKNRKAREDFHDFLLDAYVEGLNAAAYIIGTEAELDTERAERVIDWYYPNADESVLDKFTAYIKGGDVGALWRLWESEAHRAYVQGEIDGAYDAGARKKVWCTMLDDRVRDSHAELEGVTLDLYESFQIGDDYADGPGLFSLAENNANCRCVLNFR
ncbi:MAG: phage head morphogenesis protein [Clostridia bacterium]|nr:phage head morphogenesis protein [Clostridia bacterium]